MGSVFCVIGKSASGKDTIYQRLLADGRLDTRRVVPYTTRPMRENEIPGENYFYCSEEEVLRMEQEGRIIELRSYHTAHGIWKYFTADDGQIDLEKNNYLLIGTIETYVSLKNYFGADAVVPIYIEVSDVERLQRALDREKLEKTPRLKEMCRRFLADLDDFSEEKIKEAGIVKRFYNQNLEQVMEEIVSYIKERS